MNVNVSLFSKHVVFSVSVHVSSKHVVLPASMSSFQQACGFPASMWYSNKPAVFQQAGLPAVADVSFDITAGETLCLVGESGSGKSVTALSIARLLPMPPARYSSGEILLNGRDVLRMTNAELRRIRGGVVSYVFQEPSASLNPVFPVGKQIKESLKLHRPDVANDDEVIRLLKLVGIPAPDSRFKDYPHQMSGGMQQRVMIAMALASQPKLLIADAVVGRENRTSRPRR